MEIIIRNLGPVKEFKYDLSKDLNVIFGKNNIGKSYAITAVYLILKQFTSREFLRNNVDYDYFLFRSSGKALFETESNNDKISKLNPIQRKSEKKLIEWYRDKSSNDYNISKEIETGLEMAFSRSFIPILENSFKNSYSSIEALSNKFTKEALEIVISLSNATITLSTKDNHLYISSVNLNREIYIKKSINRRTPLSNQDKVIFYCNKQDKLLETLVQSLSYVYFNLKQEITRQIGSVFFLPASRSGLYQALSTFSAVIAELSKSRMFLSNKLELPNISEPVSDYFIYLSNIATSSVNKEFTDVIKNLEDTILQGKILFNNESKKIVFAPDAIDAELDLSFTSSMVSEIAPIVAFLKYVIKSSIARETGYSYLHRNERRKAINIIFIEEPEAHLHPEVQIQLMKVFTDLANLGVKVIMTSHSNYMFNKLSNLILEKQIDFKKIGSHLMKFENEGSILDELSMKADSDGIVDENFADVAEELYEERIKIYDKLNINVKS